METKKNIDPKNVLLKQKVELELLPTSSAVKVSWCHTRDLRLNPSLNRAAGGFTVKREGYCRCLS